jgi:flotillin
MSTFGIIVIVLGIVVAIMAILAVSATLFRKVGPNQALIVYGFGGTKVVKGSGKVVWPMVQQARELSLELMSFDVAPTQDLYTSQGVAVNVEAVTQIKVKSDPVSILTAAEQFLNKPPMEREALIRLVCEGHLRGIVGQLTIEHIVKEPEMVADRMRSNVADDMSKMGLEVISFTIKEVRDGNDYIANMGKPNIALIKREADIATAEAERDTAIKRAHAMREARIAEAQAKQDEVIAQTASETKQAEATRDLNLKQAEYEAAVQAQKAAADKAYEIQTNVQQQRVVEEQVKIEQVRKEREVAVQEAEILRREKELIATVLKAAEVERKRIETLAEAEKQRQVLDATGESEATKLAGQAQAEVIRAKGLAEADAIQARGQAEANALQTKATAYQEFNQAAVLDRLLASMPDVVRALSEPLAKVDKITVVSTGSDGANGGTGVNRVTSDLTQMVAQVPALFETLTGVKVEDLLRGVPQALGSGDGSGPAPKNGSTTNGSTPVVTAGRPADATPAEKPATAGGPERAS